MGRWQKTVQRPTSSRACSRHVRFTRERRVPLVWRPNYEAFRIARCAVKRWCCARSAADTFWPSTVLQTRRQHIRDRRNGLRCLPRPLIERWRNAQMSISSTISIASSTSIPEDRTGLSIFECPDRSCTARGLPVHRRIRSTFARWIECAPNLARRSILSGNWIYQTASPVHCRC
jgi:hypothetical protein